MTGHAASARGPSPYPPAGPGGGRRPFRYYGQHGEDFLLWQFFGFRRSGFFLDIGAHDGISLSNTRSFEEQGWRGICVEPVPDVADRCRQLRDRVVQAACIAGPAHSVTLTVDRSGLWAGIDVDTTEATLTYAARDLGTPGFHTIEVPAIRAATLLRPDDPPIDFATIDVEGTEIDVLKGLDLRVNRPRVLVVEALTAEALYRMDSFMAGNGYERARSVVCNHFYVQTARDARRLRGITINCALTIPDIPRYGSAGMGTHAWSPPATATRVGFVIGKVSQRLRDLRHRP